VRLFSCRKEVGPDPLETLVNPRSLSLSWSGVGLWLAAGLWVLAVGGGFAALWVYKSTPGVAAAPPPTWPEASRIEPARDNATLVMFAHPRCTCTRASLHELGQLLARVAKPPRVVVAFVLPDGAGDDWSDTDLWRSAAAIPGARVVADRGSREASLFASRTSGTALLYDAAGRLEFSGGITSLRAHEGDSAGQERLVALLAGHEPDKSTSPVFGCALDDETKETQP
jgi:hypothetical protein